MRLLLSIVLFAPLPLLPVKSTAQDLFEAFRNNDLAQVRSLVDQDSSVIGLRDNLGNSPLHGAAISGSIEIAEFLLSRGADIHAVNTRMNIPLVEAILNNRNEASRLLIDRGADIESKNDTRMKRDIKGFSL